MTSIPTRCRRFSSSHLWAFAPAKYQNPEGVLFVNPGSAGPCRFQWPGAVARQWVSQAKKVEAEVMELKSQGTNSPPRTKDTHSVPALQHCGACPLPKK